MCTLSRFRRDMKKPSLDAIKKLVGVATHYSAKHGRGATSCMALRLDRPSQLNDFG